MLTRRELFGTGIGAFVMLGDLKAVVNPHALKLVDMPSGQVVEDIIIGGVGTPTDEQYFIEFYKEHAPKIAEVGVPLNMRATFRWVPVLHREIRLKPGERLLWRTSPSFPVDHPWRVAVHMRGCCLATGRTVINQCEFSA